jgi:hypothetical protein
MKCNNYSALYSVKGMAGIHFPTRARFFSLSPLTGVVSTIDQCLSASFCNKSLAVVWAYFSKNA